MRFLKDLVQFFNDMGTLPRSIKIWAVMYPLPQFLGGIFFIQTMPGLVILIGRVASFCISSQVHKRSPFSKLIGPIGHAHWLLIVPYLVHTLLTQALSTPLYWFVVYVVVLTLISAVIDVRDTINHFKQGNSEYKR